LRPDARQQESGWLQPAGITTPGKNSEACPNWQYGLDASFDALPAWQGVAKVSRMASAAWRLTVITGYMDENENVFCANCWKKSKAVVEPVSVLDTVDPDEPDDKTPFWVVDNCLLCGVEVKYKDIKLLA
jgi:hypothetical protein